MLSTDRLWYRPSGMLQLCSYEQDDVYRMGEVKRTDDDRWTSHRYERLANLVLARIESLLVHRHFAFSTWCLVFFKFLSVIGMEGNVKQVDVIEKGRALVAAASFSRGCELLREFPLVHVSSRRKASFVCDHCLAEKWGYNPTGRVLPPSFYVCYTASQLVIYKSNFQFIEHYTTQSKTEQQQQKTAQTSEEKTTENHVPHFSESLVLFSQLHELDFFVYWRQEFQLLSLIIRRGSNIREGREQWFIYLFFFWSLTLILARSSTRLHTRLHSFRCHYRILEVGQARTTFVSYWLRSPMTVWIGSCCALLQGK